MFRALLARRRVLCVVAAGSGLAGCWGGGGPNPDQLGSTTPPAATQTAAPSANAIGTGPVKVALVLPLTASGNAGTVAQSMRNGAELAMAQFETDIQVLPRDDAGNSATAQQVTEQAIGDGAEIILGPLFSTSVQSVGQVARARNIPVIAFSTDSSVAGRGVYLLSLLPESDVTRIVDYAVSQGKRSFLALIPDNAYGSVVETEFRQDVATKGGRIVAVERYSTSKPNELPRTVVQAAASADVLFIPGDADSVPAVVQALSVAGVNLRQMQLLGTGLWEDQRIFAAPLLQGAWYVAPDPSGPTNYKSFATRYRLKFGSEPARTASLSYDAVTLVAALTKTQGTKRFTPEVLTNASGFTGTDGVFRLRPDGTNQRGLAVLRVTPKGGEVVSPAPRSFASGT
ncbi:MAG: ethanolamine utilization protein EutM [Proteobacteria bacterium]|nr:MAG: ethanolamine utilization protein EutM [Pseudomonadota bacterium]